jgi:hypothetical protein
MNAISKCLLTLATLAITAPAGAQVVQKETGDALIITARPVDMWTPDTKFNQLLLNIVKEKRSSFDYFEPNGKRIAIFKTFFQDPESAPVADIVSTKLKINGFKIGNDGSTFTVQSPAAISTSELPEFIAAQNAVYAKSIEKAGNPDKLEGKESAKKFFGNLLSLATFVTVGEKFGYANANSAVIGNSVAFDLGASVQKFGKILVPRPLPQIDISTYKQADIYRVSSLKSVGMVIIAYKEPKTLESERAALAEAIFSLTGADTTPESITQEREKDFATRKQIWAECVDRGECRE